MFAVLMIEKRGHTIKQKFYDFLHPPKPKMERIDLLGSAPFFILTMVEDKNGKINADMVYKLLGRCAERLVLPSGINLPKHPNIKSFEPEYLPSVLLFNSALQLLDKSSLPPENRKVALIDEDASFKNRTESLVQRTNEIHIYTKHRDAYEPIAEKILNTWGLPLIFTEHTDGFKNCDFIISLSEIGMIAVKDVKSKKFKCFYGEGIELPKSFLDVKPNNVDSLLFASALYELCGATALGDLHFKTLKVKKQ